MILRTRKKYPYGHRARSLNMYGAMPHGIVCSHALDLRKEKMMQLPTRDDLPEFTKWVRPPFPDPDAQNVPVPIHTYSPHPAFHVRMNEDEPLILLMGSTYVLIDVNDYGESEPVDIEINHIVEEWVRHTNRKPLRVQYGDYIYDVETGEFSIFVLQDIEQEYWNYDGETFRVQT